MSFLILWLGVMFPLVFSPGPANIVFATSGAQIGVKRSIPLLCGIDLVFILKSIAIGYGFGAIIQQYPFFLQILQFIGAIYIVYLAIGFLKSSLKNVDKPSRTLGFKDGVIIQLLNAKGWIMVVLMYSLFTEAAYEVAGKASIVLLIVMLALLNVSMHFVWIQMGGLMTKFMATKANQRIQNAVYFLSLVMVAVWLIVDNPFWETM